MTNPKQDGGTAFPAYYDAGDHDVFGSDGMSLRDWFAGQALVAMIDRVGEDADTAEWAYDMADAMLKARTTPQGGEG